MEIKQYTLPAFAWLSSDIDNDSINTRDVLMHVRSASVVEFIESDNFTPTAPRIETIHMPEHLGGKTIYAIPHFIAGDTDIEDEDLYHEIMKQCITYYMEWSEREHSRALDEYHTDFLSNNN